MLSTATLMPIWDSLIPPLLDYPDHLARAYVIANHQTIPELSQYYRVEWGLIPNLASDLIVPILCRIMPIYNAGAAFLSISILVTVSGVAILHRLVHREWSPWSFLVFFFIFNSAFLLGFVNYVFGVGVALWGFIAWLTLRDKHPALAVVVCTTVALALFFFHLAAFGFYAICCFGYELYRLGPRSGINLKPFLLAQIQFVVPALLMFLGSATGTQGLEFRTLEAKIHMLAGSMGYLVYPVGEAAPLISIWLPVLVVVLAAFGRLRVERSLVVPFALLVLAVLVLPKELFGSHGLDNRLLYPSALVGIVATNFAPRVRGGGRVLVAILIVLPCLFRIGEINTQWNKSQVVYDAYRHAYRQLPSGSTMGTLIGPPDSRDKGWSPLWHIDALAVIESDVFVPLFATKGQQPISYVNQQMYARARHKRFFEEGPKPDWEYMARVFDSVLVIGGPDFLSRVPANWRPIEVNREFGLFATSPANTGRTGNEDTARL